MPHQAEEGLVDWTTHRRQVEALFGVLAGSGAHILLSLHPKSQRSNYSAMAQDNGLILVDQALRDVLPVADIFVASFSSTVQWALLLGTPVAVFDPLQRGYRMFEHLEE